MRNSGNLCERICSSTLLAGDLGPRTADESDLPMVCRERHSATGPEVWLTAWSGTTGRRASACRTLLLYSRPSLSRIRQRRPAVPVAGAEGLKGLDAGWRCVVDGHAKAVPDEYEDPNTPCRPVWRKKKARPSGSFPLLINARLHLLDAVGAHAPHRIDTLVATPPTPRWRARFIDASRQYSPACCLAVRAPAAQLYYAESPLRRPRAALHNMMCLPRLLVAR